MMRLQYVVFSIHLYLIATNDRKQ